MLAYMYSLVIKVLCVLVALYLIGWYVKVYEPELYQQFNAILTGGVSSEAPQTPSVNEQVAQKEAVVPPASLPYPAFSWVMTEALPDESLSMPRTTIALKVNNQVITAGTFPGLCTVIERPESPNELTGVLCWFAGAGDEIGVFEEGNRLVLKRGEIAEPSAESPGFRGNFIDIAVIQ